MPVSVEQQRKFISEDYQCNEIKEVLSNCLLHWWSWRTEGMHVILFFFYRRMCYVECVIPLPPGWKCLSVCKFILKENQVNCVIFHSLLLSSKQRPLKSLHIFVNNCHYLLSSPRLLHFFTIKNTADGHSSIILLPFWCLHVWTWFYIGKRKPEKLNHPRLHPSAATGRANHNRSALNV